MINFQLRIYGDFIAIPHICRQTPSALGAATIGVAHSAWVTFVIIPSFSNLSRSFSMVPLMAYGTALGLKI